MRRRLTIAILVLVVTATACRQSPLAVEVPDATVIEDDRILVDPDAVATLALADLESFWARRLPETYDRTFTPLRGGYHPFGPQRAAPSCGDESLSYDEVAENALYCPADDLIAWDRVGLLPPLQDRFGQITTGVVLAHEFAHAIQARGGVRASTVVLELQADCFAGAWLADASDRLATFAADEASLDLALAGLLELRDALGIPGSAEGAHGSGFDRVSAFQDGFEGGTLACTPYPEGDLEVVAIPFGSARDRLLGGNLPIDQLLEPLVADLEAFFADVVETARSPWDPVDELVAVSVGDQVRCNGTDFAGADLAFLSAYCSDSDSIVIDTVGLVPALARLGDFAFGGELTRLYAVATMHRLGRPLDGVEAARTADCLSGAFGAAEFDQVIPDQRLELSPGDLDEVILGFLTVDVGSPLSAFERTAAYRTGFVSGAASCLGL